MFYKRTAKGIPSLEIWFRNPELKEKKDCPILFYHDMAEEIVLNKGEYLLTGRNARTLVSDLTLSQEDLMMRCEGTTRYKIRRAAKEGAICKQYTSDELLGRDELIRQFDDAYAEMHRKKEMAVVSVANYMRRLCEEGMLSLSACEFEGEIVAYHVYIVGDGIARLLYSVSIFRDTENSAKRAAIARCNRCLHYEDMLWFKKWGYEMYDWGGYATDSALEGINAFKKGFGGEEQPRYHAVMTNRKYIQIGYKIWKKVRRS